MRWLIRAWAFRSIPTMVALLSVGLCLAGRPSEAVVILDSTWRAEGGAKGREWAGFGAALALAAEPQFASVLALSSDGESWGEASGTWIGNDTEGHAFILTAAHIFDLPVTSDAYVVRSPQGKVLKVQKVWVHPRWNGSIDRRSGFDLVLMRLAVPLEGMGAPPMLYGGTDELGKVLTFVGYGSRGIGSVGEDERFDRGSDKAAAQGMVDEVVPLNPTVTKKGDAGNYLSIFLAREDGSIPNPFGGSNKPTTRLSGLLGAGDSGGSGWLKIDGQWVLAAVNSNGDGDATYGCMSWFTRVSPHRDWIRSIFPQARFWSETDVR